MDSNCFSSSAPFGTTCQCIYDCLCAFSSTRNHGLHQSSQPTVVQISFSSHGFGHRPGLPPSTNYCVLYASIAELASNDPVGKIINKTPYSIVVEASVGISGDSPKALLTSLSGWLMNGGALISKSQFTISPDGSKRFDEDDLTDWSTIQRAIAQNKLTSTIK